MKKVVFFCLCLVLTSGLYAQEPDSSVVYPSNEAVYNSGIEFGLFLDQAEKRRQMWLDNFEKGSVPTSLKERVEQLEGPFYLIAVAVDGCSDSVNTIPYLAHLANASDHVNMHLVSPDAGRHIMEAHRTPDDRPSTPTVLILDADFDEIGVFIERPKELQDWALGEGRELGSRDFMTAKFAWYDQDLGLQTMSEVISIIEQHLAESGRIQN